MKITNVKVRLVENGDRLKGIASVSFEEMFLVHDIKIVEGKDGLFISMPSKKQKTNEGEKHVDIAHPLNNTFRDILTKAVLEAYQKELANPTPKPNKEEK